MEDKESVPLMLKPSAKAGVNIVTDSCIPVSGQESMEAFINMSQSKGIDSFINLAEPEFSDLMSMSQPSMLYVSLTSSINELMNLTCVKNDTTPLAAANNTITKSNDDVDETSSSNGSNNETFVMHAADKTIVANNSYCANPLGNTFCKESAQLEKGLKGLNATYDAEAAGEASAPRRSLEEDANTATLSSTFVTGRNADATFVQPYNKASNDIGRLDTTYLFSAGDAEGSSSPRDIYIPTTHANKADLNVTCNIVTDGVDPAEFLETPLDETVSEMSFKVPFCNQSTPMNPNVLNPTSKLAMKRPDQSRQAQHSTTLKAPTSLRRELLAEIQRSDERKLDSTYNHIHSDHPDARDTKENLRVACNENETDAPPSNRYNTYRKSTLAATVMTNQCTSRNEAVIAQDALLDQRKFYTFTKKSNNHAERTGNADTDRNAEVPHPNMDGTFCKPLPPKAQKRNRPKMLSKLPQFLQKSNPNLVSGSLKSGHASGLPTTGISSVGYIKGSQPNIVQNVAEKSHLPNKLHPYGKLKSGSEQRLLDANTNNTFPMKSLAAGSTESIESTQSAHSAPDLDDRLSTCSDSSSQNSCTRPTMNIEQLHQLVRMQEESKDACFRIQSFFQFDFQSICIIYLELI